MSDPTILDHTLAISLYAHSSFWDGWTPSITGHLAGPVPSGAELVVELSKDGATCWTGSTELDAADDGELQRFDLGDRDEEHQLREAGTYAVSMRIVSELDGVDESVYEGSFTVVDDGGVHHVDDPARAGVGYVVVDTGSDWQHPEVGFCLWYPGETPHLEAHLFFEGKRLRPGGDDDPASLDTWSGSISDPRNNPTYTRIVGTFDRSRAYANGNHSDAGTWHVLDRNPGSYEIKILADSKLDRSIPFTVDEDGRIVAEGYVATDPKLGWVIAAPVVPKGGVAGELPTGGNATLDEVYADREGPAPAGSDDDLDEDEQEEFENAVDKARNMHNWYWEAMETGETPYNLYDQCTGVGVHLPMALEALDTWIGRLGGSRVVPWFDGDRTLDEVRAEMVHLGDRAQHWVDLRDGATSNRLAPFRALLRGEKLAIFDDRPIGDYHYTTRGKRPLTTPEEVAEADTWWFEGTDHIGTVNERWTLIGWRFDADGNIVERLGTSGAGRFAPVAEYS